MQKSTKLNAAGRTSWLFGFALILTPFFACSSASVIQSIDPQVEISLEPAPAGGSDEAPTITTASAESVVLSGVISTPNPCYTFNAAVAVDGQDLTLTVTAHSQPRICVQMLGLFSYEATVTGLTAGSYPTRLVYEYPDTGWESKEYELQLRVP